MTYGALHEWFNPTAITNSKEGTQSHKAAALIHRRPAARTAFWTPSTRRCPSDRCDGGTRESRRRNGCQLAVELIAQAPPAIAGCQYGGPVSSKCEGAPQPDGLATLRGSCPVRFLAASSDRWCPSTSAILMGPDQHPGDLALAYYDDILITSGQELLGEYDTYRVSADAIPVCPKSSPFHNSGSRVSRASA